MEWDDLDTLGSEEERLLQSVTEEQEIYFDGKVGAGISGQSLRMP